MLLAKKIFFGILKFALIGLLCIMLLFPLYYLLLHSLVSPKTITDNKAYTNNSRVKLVKLRRSL